MNPSVAVSVEVQTDECAKELLLSYFPVPIVKETLKKFEIPQDKWESILSALSTKDKEIVKLVEQKAATMSPNPLKDPQQRQAAVKLFRETLLDAFSKSLQDNGVTDSSKYQAMLDDIQQQKAKKFAMCMEKQKQKAEELDKSAPMDSSDDSDDDESEDDESDSDDNEEDEEDSDDSSETVKDKKTFPSPQ